MSRGKREPRPARPAKASPVAPARRVTIRDIAAKLGLHFTTVAMALRHDPRVAAATATRILRAAERMGYEKDPLLNALSDYRARQRPRRFLGNIAMLHDTPLADIRRDNPFGATIFKEAEAQAVRRGYCLEFIEFTAPSLRQQRLSNILVARGIRGVLIAPTKDPGASLDLDWQHFSSVAIGYTLQSPRLHRATYHQFLNTVMHVRRLRSLGFRRVGLVLYRNSDLRTEHLFLGAFLGETHSLPEDERVPPLVSDNLDAATVGRWIREHRPDVIINAGEWVARAIVEAGFRIPADVSLSEITVPPGAKDLAGWDERPGALGAVAVDFLISLIAEQDVGIPRTPRYMMIDGEWRPGRNVVAPRPSA